MQYDVIFKEGESCKWRCMLDDSHLQSIDGITTAKWYDAKVDRTFGSAMTLCIVNNFGEPMTVPHYTVGEWGEASQVGILDPALATERMITHTREKINAQKEEHKNRLEKLYVEMESIKIEGYVDEPAIPVETNEQK